MSPARTAVVVVHGMGEQRPLQTLKGFVKTALKAVRSDGSRLYYSRPALLTRSYEARRYIAFQIDSAGGELVRGQTDLFEYHWSYLMTGNRFGDLMPTSVRLLTQPFSRVPRGLRGVWCLVWLAALALVILNVAGLLRWRATLDWLVRAAIANGVVLAAVLIGLWMAYRLKSGITQSFVDVVRYLDTSPRSYAARRAIRAGMVDLLRGLHEDGGYSRVVVVAHSLGGYIAYDALGSLWTELFARHAAPLDGARPAQPLRGLADVQAAATAVLDGGPVQPFQEAQFAVWRGLRAQGNPWLVTDLLTVGTPMYFADLLYTRSRAQFVDLIRDGELWRCPPRSETQTVDAATTSNRVRYGWRRGGYELLGSWSMFAALRWTNVWFPTRCGFFGDWFGGALSPLFGPGVRDVAVTGNRPGRFLPALAHVRYFSYPDAVAPDDIATYIRDVLALDLDPALFDRDQFPPTDPTSAAHPIGVDPPRAHTREEDQP